MILPSTPRYALGFTLICGCVEAVDLLAQLTDAKLYMESRIFQHIRYSEAQWLLYVPPGLTFSISPFCPQSVCMCFVWI